MRDPRDGVFVQEVKLRLAFKKTLDVLSVSQSVESFLGYRPADLLTGKVPFASLVHPVEAAAVEGALLSEAGHSSGEFNVRIRHADGRIRCLRLTYEREGFPNRDPSLNVTLSDASSTMRDEASERSSLTLQAVIESMEECAYLKDRHHVIVAANQNYSSLFPNVLGRPRDVIGLTDYDLFPEAYADQSYALEERVLKGEPGAHVTQEAVGRDGKDEWLDHRKFPVRDGDGKVIGLLTIVSVITDGVLAEKALRESEQSLKEAQRIADVGSFTLDLQKRTWTGSEMLYEILGLEKDVDGTVALWNALIDKNDVPALVRLYGEALVEKRTMLDGETRFVRQTDEAKRWARVRGKLEFDAQGKSIVLRGTIADITDQKDAEEELRKSAGLLEIFIQDAPTGLAMFDREMRYMSASRRWIEDHGLEEGEIVGRRHCDLGYTIPERWKDDYRRALANETVSSGEDCYQLENGRTRWVRNMVRSWLTGNGEVGGVVILSEDITARKIAEEALRESREVLQLFIKHAPAAIAMFDCGMRYVSASQRWLETFSLVGQDILGLSHYDVFPGIPERWKEAHRRGMAGQGTRMEEDRFDRADGITQWVRWEIVPWRGVDGEVDGIVLFVEDISVQKASDERLKLAANVFAHASEAIMITDAGGNILDVNESFTRITGYERDEVLGLNPRILHSGRQTREFYAEMWAYLKEHGHWSGEIWNRTKEGRIYAESLTISAVRDSAGDTQQYVAMFSDITPIKEKERQLSHVAHFDLLTGLPNRVLLADRLRQAMARAHRLGHMVAVANLDLDNFRSVNELHKPVVGDLLLTAIASRMSAVLRKGDTLARLGGDEFVAVLPNLCSIEEALPLTAKLLDAVAEPVHLGELKLQMTASIGVAFFPQPEDVEPDQLLRQADQAMYYAKLAGGGRSHIFDPALDRSLRGRHEDLHRIRIAIAANEFQLYFQPKVNMSTGTILGAEALIRWNHPDRGLLAPWQFLPILEGNPLVVELGDWVIRGALAQMEEWRGAGVAIPVSVNVDGLQLQHAGFAERLAELLARYPEIPPSQFELEILESSALQDVAIVSEVIRACTKVGVTIALDDFGTGYSSLSYLRRLPVDILKIDQSFVHDMLDNPEDLTILEGILALTKAFRRKAVAEGVETADHGLMLLRLGCQIAQGYGIARPMPATELLDWMKNWRPHPQWANVSPVDQANWPVLYASVEHRAWINAVEGYVNGVLIEAPTMDHHHCRFGSWLDAEAWAGRGDNDDFQAIDASHQRLHGFANGMLKLTNHDRERAEAQAGLRDLQALRDDMFDKVQSFVQSL
jgi:diguanylate cyclase (GGDEF)-like protein/PAS domain S-box-containing protein